MNKRVLKTMIYLCWAFLIVYALLKTVWGVEFAAAISNPSLIEFGNFVDSHAVLRYAICFLTTCFTYHFYLCACCSKWHLSVKEYLLSLIVVVIVFVINAIFPQYGTIFSFISMLVIPYFLKAEYKSVLIFFTTHTLGQLIITVIRSEPMNIMFTNTITQLVCLIDMYIWLVLYYLYSNLYKENIMGIVAPPLWGKMDKSIQEEIDRLDKKIESETDPVKIEKYKKEKEAYLEMVQNKG